MSNEVAFLLGIIIGQVIVISLRYFADAYHKKKERKVIEEILSNQPSNDLLNINDIPTYTRQYE